MSLSDFSFELPAELIAQYPLAERTASRLLVLDGATSELVHTSFDTLADWLREGDLLVMNDTRVIPARMFGRKETGGRVEIMLERVLDRHRVLTRIRASKSPPFGSSVLIGAPDQDPEAVAVVEGRQGEFYIIRFTDEQRSAAEIIANLGEMPLPPYIERAAEPSDQERYQTVYARHPGAVAAPTAGLHFDSAMLDTLRKRGIGTAFVTLHVGAGTFQPVREQDIDQHVMHEEFIDVPEVTVDAIHKTRSNGGRVIAVGTTCVRSLETAALSGELQPYRGETRLFIRPGVRFRVVDGMITNFHLPESTLLMLVAAFAGHAEIMRAYAEAIAERYRFFSYGDAMLLWPDRDSWQRDLVMPGNTSELSG